jgi:Rad3-related DNA helicase
MPDTPQDWGLPLDHTVWRPGQRAALDYCRTKPGVKLLEAPTGSGKTSLPAATGHRSRTLALCRTKNLQVDNYQHTYNFSTLFGKSNYPCIHHDADPGATCADCLYTKRGQKGRGMYDCEVYDNCVYLDARSSYLNSRRASANYAYWLSSSGARKDSRDYIFLDECHQLVDLVLEYCGITVDNDQRARWGLPPFPKANSKMVSATGIAALLHVDEDPPEDKVLDWIDRSHLILEQRLSEMQASEVYRKESPEDRKKAREAEQLMMKLETLGESLAHGDWYIKSGFGAVERGGGKYPGIVARPLSPRAHFSRFFPVAEANRGELALVLMSATIGNFDVFADQLGIETFGSHVVPSRFGPDEQPIYDLEAPGMGRKAKPNAYEEQADLIAKAILTVPHDWSGIVHVTRIREAPLLARRLAERGLNGRLWVTPRGPTNSQMAAFKARMRQVPNTIAVAWSMWEGVDLLDQKISIMAKTPFPYLGTEYGRRRMKANGAFYLQMAAWQLEQAAGRTRRGRPMDYDTADEKRGLVAIADGNWRRVRKYMSAARREAIVKGMP